MMTSSIKPPRPTARIISQFTSSPDDPFVFDGSTGIAAVVTSSLPSTSGVAYDVMCGVIMILCVGIIAETLCGCNTGVVDAAGKQKFDCLLMANLKRR